MIILKNYKRILTLALVLVMAVSCFTGCQVKKNPISVGSVNGIELTDDVYAYFMHTTETQFVQSVASPEEANAFWDKETDGKKGIDLLRETTKEYVVSLCVLNAKAKEMNIALTDAEKEAIKAQISSDKKAQGETAFKKYLKQMGVTEETLQKAMELEYVANKVSTKLSEEDERLIVTDDEAKAYIAEKEKITAKHILFDTTDPETGAPLSDEGKAEIKVIAQEALDKIKSGEEDFDAVMNDLSADPGLQSNPDGYFFGKGEMVKEFEDAAYALNVGQMSELVETEYGFHIIKRVEDNLENAKELVMQDNYEIVIDELTKDAKVELNEKVINKIKPIKY